MTAFEDVQRMHYEKLGVEISYRQMALRKAAEQYGIIMSKKESHCALYDAGITAKILVLLETGKYQKQAKLLRKTACDRRESSMTGVLLGELYKDIFEQIKMQEEKEVLKNHVLYIRS